MATQHQNTRDSSRNRSFDEYPEPSTHHTNPNSKTGTKRLFSNREAKLTDEDHGENAELDIGEDDSHTGKRHRSGNWPLTNASPPPSRAPLRNRNAPNSPNLRRTSQPRPSKFVEGSMNDRVSKQPPQPYIGGDEGFQTRYEREQIGDFSKRKMAHPKKFTHHANASMAESSVADRSDASRHSSIFRFGKSLASSFNPSNWKIWKHPSQEAESAEQRTLRERREKAERMYQELKTAGYFRSNDGHAEQVSDQKPSVKHDSGVEFGHEITHPRMSEEISKEDKRMGRIFLEPPKFVSPRATGSPVSNASEPVAKQSFHFKKPSLSNIKKALTSESPSNSSTTGEHHARRVPSRKDMQTQMKLVKRVSDLEGKLEAARRQLAEVQGEPLPFEPPPRKSRFVPGALSSLPSERLISGYISSEYENDIGKAVTTDKNESGARVELDLDKPLPEPRLESPHEVMQSVETDMVENSIEVETGIKEVSTHQVNIVHKTPATTETSNSGDSSYDEEESARDPTAKHKPTPKKRKSTVFERMADDGGKYKPSDSDVESEAESDVKKPTLRKKNSAAGPRKLQKTIHKELPSTPDLKNVSPQNQRNPAPRYQASKGLKLKQTPPKPQLVKGKLPGRQSASPPPSSAFTGLKYSKPSTKKVAEAKQAAYTALPSTDDVPPMPKMPNAVRLPSGEVISTAAKSANAPARVGSKLTKARPVTKEGEGREKKQDEQFDWPDDVF